MQDSFPIVCLGLLFFTVGYFSLKSTMPNMECKKKTEAKVIGYVEKYDVEHGIMWSSVYEFDVDGKPYEITSSLCSNSKERLGKVVKIEYDECDPEIAAIPSERFLPALCTIIGIVLIIFGVNKHLESKSENSNTYVDVSGLEVLVEPQFSENN